MAGTAAARELSRGTGFQPVGRAGILPADSAAVNLPGGQDARLPHSQDGCAPMKVRFAAATPADDAALRRLLRENPMRGAVSVRFEREPDYFRGANLAGGVDQTIVAHDGGRLVCMGRCTERACWVDGHETRVGYLAELRLDSVARGRFGILRDGYEFFREMQGADPAAVYFTSIATDNERARRLLESGTRGLPRYDFLAELDTLLVAVPRRPRKTKLRVEAATPEHVPDLLRVLNASGRRHQLAAVWTAENLAALAERGLPLERFLLAIADGEVVACGALWDQRGFRQTVIHGYSRALAVARPCVNFASRILGTPHLPRPGAVLAHAFLSPLAIAVGAEAMLPDFVEAFFPLAARAGVVFLTLALPTTDSRLPTLRWRFTTRTWRSRLYRVAWPEQPRSDFEAARFLPDVALL